jgi:hypothetical protein
LDGKRCRNLFKVGWKIARTSREERKGNVVNKYSILVEFPSTAFPPSMKLLAQLFYESILSSSTEGMKGEEKMKVSVG